ncbi:lysine-specific demethylase JMJ28-like [Humulus lupulus]|uniref:lysine-specific demethylase JMJ28-like n=1 Tax=Humulus lupulus TaxID=3486 RepID=UPI002B4176F4|nr:lysine-specific demethylase JMJ28-like [Humulus lupulus]
MLRLSAIKSIPTDARQSLPQDVEISTSIYFNSQEVKDACPVCCKICTCKDCLENPSKDSESKDFLGDKHEVEVILCFHYLICMLLPVLKQINKDQNDELEIEARIRGQKPSDLHIKQVDTECSKQHCWYAWIFLAMMFQKVEFTFIWRRS